MTLICNKGHHVVIKEATPYLNSLVISHSTIEKCILSDEITYIHTRLRYRAITPEENPTYVGWNNSGYGCATCIIKGLFICVGWGMVPDLFYHIWIRHAVHFDIGDIDDLITQ
jgi:hypothetical protein